MSPIEAIDGSESCLQAIWGDFYPHGWISLPTNLYETWYNCLSYCTLSTYQILARLIENSISSQTCTLSPLCPLLFSQSLQKLLQFSSIQINNLYQI